MMGAVHGALGPGDRAPDFELESVGEEGTVSLADHRRRGPVLVAILRGLYCPFCRRHLRPVHEALRAGGVALLGVVIASRERARQYFRHFPAAFPIGVAPDRTIHRAYGLPEMIRTPAFREEVERKAAAMLGELGVEAPSGKAATTLAGWNGFEMTAEDASERERPVQAVGYFLVDREGLIRWASVDTAIPPLPAVKELLPLV